MAEESVEALMARLRALERENEALREAAEPSKTSAAKEPLQPFVRFRDEAPLFVAVPFGAAVADLRQVAERPRVALFALSEAVESIGRFIALTAAIGWIRANDGRAPDWLSAAAFAQLRRPTFGSWLLFLRTMRGRRSSLYDALDAFVSDLDALCSDCPERKPGLIAVRNAIAHGGGAGAGLGAAAVTEWTERVGAFLETHSWIAGIEIWTRSGGAAVRLNGTDIDGRPADPPTGVSGLLREGALLMAAGAHVIPLAPLANSRLSGSSEPIRQLFARQSEAGILYSAFGPTPELQFEGGEDERRSFEAMFDFERARRALREAEFREKGYDEEFRRDADALVGRGEQLDRLFIAVQRREQGIVALFGAPGIGKSTLIARAAMDLRASSADPAEPTAGRKVLVYRFVEGDRGCSPHAFLRWALERTGVLLGLSGAPKPDATPNELLETMLERLRRQEDSPRLVLVLDGLDEMARREAPFVERLIAALSAAPRCVTLLGARPDGELRALVARHDGEEPLGGDLAPMNVHEIRAMMDVLLSAITHRLVRSDIDDEGRRNRLIEVIVERSKGFPNYVQLVIRDLLRGHYRAGEGWDLAQLPQSVNDYYTRITAGLVSDAARHRPLIAALLALAREPLSTGELAAFLMRALDLSEPSYRTRLEQLAADVVGDFGSLLKRVDRPALDPLNLSPDRTAFRLFHDGFVQHLLHAEDMRFTLAEARRLLADMACSPGEDALTPYLYRNGIVHLLDPGGAAADGAERAAALLGDFEYQIARLQVLTKDGGDGGLREDWLRVARHAPQVPAEADEWRRFWMTDGAVFQPGAGRSAPHELLERALQYAPDTAVGRAADLYLAQPA